jgi:hypothetical protein
MLRSSGAALLLLPIGQSQLEDDANRSSCCAHAVLTMMLWCNLSRC